jgi:penicillin-binding protein 1A
MKKHSNEKSFMNRFVTWAVMLSFWAFTFVVAFLAVMAIDLPDTSKLTKPQKEASITYLDRSGALIAVRGSPFAPPVDLDKIPNYVPLAFVALEDKRFFQHPGFDPIGIGRAIIRNTQKKDGQTREGGSTITQQLAKNLFLSNHQNLKRKVQELILAIWLEVKFTKKEILALYLNRVYFGGGAYGIEAASQRYFNKETKDLTVGEAAMLAGLLKNPSGYNPVSNEVRAGKRATFVLKEMVATKVITKAEYDLALKTPLQVSRSSAIAHAQYFVDWIDQQVREQLGEIPEDLIVETTLDLQIQNDAERAVQDILKRDIKKKVEQVALVSLDGEGRVRAMIGGASYANSEFNRATRAYRQTGSTFKPFVYLAGMNAGYSPQTPVVDEPYSINGWTPENYTKKYLGHITLETALEQSVNTVSARLADKVGRPGIAQLVRSLGVKSKINTDPAMALGTAEATPLEMAQAYAPFANGGYRVNHHAVIRIRTAAKGQILYQYRGPAEDGGRVRVINNPSLLYMNQMMRGVITRGTGTGIKLPGYDIAGKTGTTSDYRDAWFAGYTGGFVTIVWVGRDDNTPMARVTGGGTPAAIWRSYMSKALSRVTVSPIPTGPEYTPLDGPIRSLIDGEEYAAMSESSATDINEAPPAELGLDPLVVVTPETPKPNSGEKNADELFAEAERNGH